MCSTTTRCFLDLFGFNANAESALAISWTTTTSLEHQLGAVPSMQSVLKPSTNYGLRMPKYGSNACGQVAKTQLN